MTQIKFDMYSFYRSGNSIVVSIPQPIIESLKIQNGDAAVMYVEEGKIIIEKKE